MDMLLAQRGVRGENPENTMPAFRAAADQGYGYVSLTARVTRDGHCVVLHDATVNRTARMADGSRIPAALPVAERDLAQLLELDFGIGYHVKFRGTRLPLLKDVLELCRQTAIRVKLEASWYGLRPAHKTALLSLVDEYADTAELSADSLPALREILTRYPAMRIHWEGRENTGELGLGREIVRWSGNTGFGPGGLEIRATCGAEKPEQNQGLLSDMHIHTDHSHDAHYPMEQMVLAGLEKGIRVMAMADHCDVTRCENDPQWDIYTHIRNSCQEVETLNEKYRGRCMLLKSVELGDGIWYPEQSDRVAEQLPYDVIVGATHAVRCRAAEAIPLKEKWFSQIKFAELPEDQYLEFMDNYFEDMLAMVETQNIDIMAHILCAICYYAYRHGIWKDVRPWERQIDRILKTIIRKGIAMEMHGMLFSQVDGEMPYYWIVERYRALGGYLVTLSTDAHDPGEVGGNYALRLRMLKETGFTHIFYYKNRRAVPCSI